MAIVSCALFPRVLASLTIRRINLAIRSRNTVMIIYVDLRQCTNIDLEFTVIRQPACHKWIQCMNSFCDQYIPFVQLQLFAFVFLSSLCEIKRWNRNRFAWPKAFSYRNGTVQDPSLLYTQNQNFHFHPLACVHDQQNNYPTQADMDEAHGREAAHLTDGKTLFFLKNSVLAISTIFLSPSRIMSAIWAICFSPQRLLNQHQLTDISIRYTFIQLSYIADIKCLTPVIRCF